MGIDSIFIIIIFILSIIGMFICILKYPKLKIKNFQMDTFFICPLIGAVIILFINNNFGVFWNSITSNTSLNPLKILILFISISFISITLDESGFFKYISSLFVSKYKSSQFKLFTVLYILISILTVFTSNDIVILTFTPFILYLSKRGNINPIPYLVMEFVAGNTYSMMLEIGNPTNIYLSGGFNIPFLDYFIKMIVPTLVIGISSYFLLLLLFRKSLKEKINVFDLEISKINDKPLCIVSGSILAITTILLAISNYINLEMYIICSVSAGILLLFLIIYGLLNKKKETLINPVKRVPYSLIPFVLSMFILVIGLNSFNLFTNIGNEINKIDNKYFENIIYLITSTLSCNIINNIPMTLAYANILENTNHISNIYSTIIGSNLGALLTPIGALAGIMWLRILKENDIKYSFIDFMKNGIIITGFTLGVSAIMLLMI